MSDSLKDVLQVTSQNLEQQIELIERQQTAILGGNGNPRQERSTNGRSRSPRPARSSRGREDDGQGVEIVQAKSSGSAGGEDMQAAMASMMMAPMAMMSAMSMMGSMAMMRQMSMMCGGEDDDSNPLTQMSRSMQQQYMMGQLGAMQMMMGQMGGMGQEETAPRQMGQQVSTGRASGWDERTIVKRDTDVPPGPSSSVRHPNYRPLDSEPMPGITDRRFEGRVSAWFEDKGYGFIECETLKKGRFPDIDVFLHENQRRNFNKGDWVSFGVFLNFRGKPQATELRKMDEPD